MSGKKTKQKFSPLFSKDGQSKLAVQLPGRHPCQCLASRHGLVGNCVECGRIVCTQEGSGPCFTCSALVCTKEEKEVLRKSDRKSEELLTKLTGSNGSGSSRGQRLKEIANDLLPDPASKVNEGLRKALQHKEKLLEYDRTCEKRTHVIDDDSDYFAADANQWLTKDQREKIKQRMEELQNKKYASRRDRKMKFDFAGRQILEDDENVDLYNANDAIVQEALRSGNEQSDYDRSWIDEDTYSMIHKEFEKTNHSLGIPTKSKSEKNRLRLQDSELQSMSDDGWCLSVHQPYASFLVMGLKTHEGRCWYTSHRGRLWIAAAAKQPSMEEVEVAELSCKLLNKKNCVFPEQYPTSALLGCVNLADCLPQEQYIEKYPSGPSGSAYVFICEDAQDLTVKLPIQGKHKLYKLDERVHHAAVKMLLKK